MRGKFRNTLKSACYQIWLVKSEILPLASVKLFLRHRLSNRLRLDRELEQFKKKYIICEILHVSCTCQPDTFLLLLLLNNLNNKQTIFFFRFSCIDIPKCLH